MRFRMPVAAAAGSLTLAAVVSGATVAGPAAVTGATAGSQAAVVVIRPDVMHVAGALKAPPTTAFCEKHYEIACYLPEQIQQAYDLPALYRRVRGERHRPRPDDRDRRLLRLPDRPPRPGRVRQGGRPARAALAEDHPAGRQGRALPAQQQPGRLGRRDRPGRRVRARDRARRPHPAGRDPDGGERGHDRLPADRQGRGVRDQPSPRRRDQPELQRDRADASPPGSRCSACAAPTSTRRARGDRAGGLR